MERKELIHQIWDRTMEEHYNRRTRSCTVLLAAAAVIWCMSYLF